MTAFIVGYGGERLDRIARAIYGSERGGTVEALLDANPGLAAIAHPLVPAETRIEAPDTVDTAPPAGFILAWD